MDYDKFPKEAKNGRNLWDTDKEDKLAICYPSIVNLIHNFELSKYDIVIIDEARQLLAFAATASIIQGKQNLDNIMGKLVENAELVVCCDADLDDLVVKAIEVWRGDDDCFDIYWNAFKPLQGKMANMCRSPAELMSLTAELIKEKKTFALVGDFSPKRTAQMPIPIWVEHLKKCGLKDEEIFELHSFTSQNEEQQNVLCNPNKYLKEKMKNGLKAFIASPSLTSGWDYSDKEHTFDYVLGMYPHAILTAPEIIQQLRRFRETKDFYLWIRPNNQHTKYQIEKLEDIWEDLYGYTKARFRKQEPVWEDGLQREREVFDDRETIRMSDESGLDHRFHEITKASTASKCNLKLHFDMLWKDGGGLTQLSDFYDDLWRDTDEGQEQIERNQKKLKDFYQIKDNEMEIIYEGVKKAKSITDEEYKKIILEH